MRNLGAKLVAWVTVGSVLGASLPAWPQEVGTDRLRAAIERAQHGSAAQPASAATGQLDAAALQDLAAPVALYPDALLAQVLVAATFPDQIADADQLIAASADMTDAELDSALREKQWDPSVLVLMSGFPSVVSRMADDPDWTRRLGAAMVDQDADLLAAVQHLRAEAYANGALRSNEAQLVERQDDQIYIRPADPKVVYVPRYDPEVAFAEPVPHPAPRPRAFADPFPTSYAAPATSYTAPVTSYAPVPSGTATMETALVSGIIGFGAGFLVDQLFNNKHDDGGNDDWKGYWGAPRPIDWNGRQVYARPYGPGPRPGNGAWSWERDQYWDRQARHWRQDRIQEQQRQDFLRWVSVPPGGGDPSRGWHDSVRQSRAERDWYKAQVKADRQRQNDAEDLARQREKDRRAEQKQWDKLQERQLKEERARQKQWEVRQDRRAQQARDEQRARDALDAQRIRQDQQGRDRQDARDQGAREQNRARERQQARQERQAREKQQARDEDRARAAREEARQEQRVRDKQRTREDQRAKQAREQKAEDPRAKRARQDQKAQDRDRQQQEARAARREQQKAEKAQQQRDERRQSSESGGDKAKRKPDCPDGKKDCKRGN